MEEMIEITEILANIIDFFGYESTLDEDGDLIGGDGSEEMYAEYKSLYEFAEEMYARPISILKLRLELRFRHLMKVTTPIDIPEKVDERTKKYIYDDIEDIIKDLLLIAGTIYSDRKGDLYFRYLD